MIEQIVGWLQMAFTWMIAQNWWAEPIMNFLIVVACLKYIIFGRR